MRHLSSPIGSARWNSTLRWSEPTADNPQSPIDSVRWNCIQKAIGRSRWVTLLCLLALMASTASGQIVTTESLLREMADRDALAVFPSPAYQALQSSSYDRASKRPGTEDWTANRDYSQFIRTEEHQSRTEHVMMDAEGPGAVVRIWITWAGRPKKPFSNGTVRLYLDDSDDPIVEKPVSEFIDGGSSGDGGIWNEPSLAYGVSVDTPHDRRGHNLFVPIPYAKSCRITYETDQMIADDGRIDESFYYHVGYRTYAPGTAVETFSFSSWNTLKEQRKVTQQQLIDESKRTKTIPGRQGKQSNGIIEFRGPAAIDSIIVDASGFSPQQMRSTLVSLTFDGVETVRVPLDGFFTCGYVTKNFQTWMHSYRDGVMQCHYVMPFERSLVAQLVSANETQIDASLSVTTKPWQWNDRSMHFHADWRTDQNLATGIAKTQDDRNGVVDLDFLDAQGRGVIVGDSIMLFSGAARWWGEGDEKIYVDGESFPSHFGTGTEDYYGYAWCRPETFSKPFHAQPVGRGALLGGPVVNTRIRSLDAIPFRKSIDFDMELWHWSDTKTNYARTVFWYGKPGAKSSGSTPVLASKAVALRDLDITSAEKVPSAIEGESARVVSISGGEVEIDRYTLFGWSDGAQLLWKDAKPGDRLTLEFPSLSEGDHELIYTIGPDYGNVRIQNGDQDQAVNGRFIGIISVLETRKLPLQVDRQGSGRITFTMQGQGDATFRFGLDAIVPK